MIQSAFYIILKALLLSKSLNFHPGDFGHIGKQLHKKAKVNFKIYTATDWETNNYNTNIA